MLNSKDFLAVNCTSQVHGTINNVKIKNIFLNGNYLACNKPPYLTIRDDKNFKKFAKIDYKFLFWNKKDYPCCYQIKQENGEFNVRGAKLFSNMKEGDKVMVKLKVFQIYTNDRKVHNVAVITDMKKRK
jgi:hypothetical protein